jgi:hypothetical protein
LTTLWSAKARRLAAASRLWHLENNCDNNVLDGLRDTIGLIEINE